MRTTDPIFKEDKIIFFRNSNSDDEYFIIGEYEKMKSLIPDLKKLHTSQPEDLDMAVETAETFLKTSPLKETCLLVNYYTKDRKYDDAHFVGLSRSTFICWYDIIDFQDVETYDSVKWTDFLNYVTKFVK